MIIFEVMYKINYNNNNSDEVCMYSCDSVLNVISKDNSLKERKDIKLYFFDKKKRELVNICYCHCTKLLMKRIKKKKKMN
jgi:hypothetical protein